VQTALDEATIIEQSVIGDLEGGVWKRKEIWPQIKGNKGWKLR